MSLLTEAMQACVMLDKITVDDGYGGFLSKYVEGAGFSAAIVVDNSVQSRLAQSQGVLDIYTITTSKAINLQYHDVFRRTSDGKVFRVTTDGDDRKTQESAGLNMRQVQAEEWSIIDEPI